MVQDYTGGQGFSTGAPTQPRPSGAQNDGTNTPAPASATPPPQDQTQQTPKQALTSGFDKNQEHWFKLIGDRVQHMPSSMIWSAPDIAGQLAISKMGDRYITQMSQHYTTISNHISQSTSLGSMPAALAQAWTKVAMIQDPAERIAAGRTLKAMGELPPDRADAMAAYFLHPETFAGTDMLAPGNDSTISGEIANIIPGASVDQSTGEINIAADTGGQSQAQDEALLQLFPELRGKLHFSGGGITQDDITNSLNDSVMGLSYAVAKPLIDAQKAGGGWKREGIAGLEAGGTVVGAAMGGIAGGIQTIYGTAPEAGLRASGIPGATGLANAIQTGEHYAFGLPARLATNALGGVQAVFNDTVGDYAARQAGYKPGDGEAYDNAKNAIGGVAMMIALMGVGEAGAAAKASLAMPEGAAAGYLGLDTGAEAGSTASPLGSVTKTIGTLAGTPESVAAGEEPSFWRQMSVVAQHPFATLAAPEIKAFVYNALRTTPEEWINTSRAGRFINGISTTLEAASGKSQAETEAAIQMRYPIDDELTSRLAQGNSDPVQIKQTILQYYDDIATSPAKVAAAKETLQQLLAEKAAQDAAPAARTAESAATEADLGQTIDAKRSPLEPTAGERTTSGFLDEGDAARFTRQLERRQAAGEAGGVKDLGNNTYSWTDRSSIGDRTYYVTTDESGQVTHARTVDPETQTAAAETTQAASGTDAHYGTRATLAHWNELGINDLSDPEQVARLKEILARGEFSKGGAAMNKAAIRTLLDQVPGAPNPDAFMLDAQISLAQGELTDAALKGPLQLKFPGGNSLSELLHRVMFKPQGALENIFRRILSPVQAVKTWSNEILDTNFSNIIGERQPFLAKLVDKLDFSPKIYNLSRDTGTEIPWNANDANNTLIRRYLGRLNFSTDEITAWQARFRSITSDQEFYQALKDMSTDIVGKLDALGTGKTGIPASQRAIFDNLWRRSSEEYPLSMPVTMEDGTVVHKPILTGPDGESLPFVPGEFVNASHTLPSLRNVEEAMSTMSRWAENAQAAGGGSALLAKAYETSQAFLHLSTAVLKPFSLILKIPAIILRKTIDEALGNALTPGITSPLRTTSELMQDMTTLSPEDIGNPLGGALDSNLQGERVIEGVKTSDLVTRGRAEDPAVWSSQRETLAFMHADPLIRKFVQTGLDVDKMVALLRGGDEYLTQLFERGGAVNLERAGATLEDTLTNLKASIESATGGSADVLESIHTGRLLRDAGGVATDRLGASSVSRQYDALQADAKALQARIDELPAGDANLRALHDQLISTNEKITAMEDRFDAAVLHKGSKYVSIKDSQAFANEIKRRWSTGDFEMPDQIRVNRYVAQGGYDAASIAEHLDQTASNLSSGAYRRFKSIGEMEAKWARGSFYQQRAWQYYQAFKGLGIDDAEAQAWGMMKGLNETKDFFYDLTARSSVERQVRNLFWYAPVTGELLYRWLYAIPAETGSALTGLALNVAKAFNYLHMAQDFGLIQKDSVSGAYVIPIPGLGRFLQNVTGGQLNFRGLNIDVPVSSLSHLSTGNLLPGLAPIPALLLSKTAGKYGGPLKSLAGLIAPSGDSTSVAPTGIRYAMEMFGMKPPDISRDYINQQYDKSVDVSLQYAYADLVKQGDPEPQLSAFHLDKGQSDYDPAQANVDAYTASWGEWFKRLNADAQSYAHSIFFLKEVQSTVFPGQLTYSSQEQRDYQSFFQDHILPQIDPTTHQLPQAATDELNGWLGDHPNSLAFSISYNYYTGKPYTLPYKETGDKYSQDLYDQNLKATMTPDEYGQYLAASASHRFYIAQQNASLHDISPNLDPAEILRNWGQRSTAVTTATDNWNTYLSTNKDAKAIIDKTDAGYSDFEKSLPPNERNPNAADTPLAVQYATDAMTALSGLSGEFTGTGNVTNEQYNKVMSNLKAIRAANFQETGGSETPLTQGLNWYFDNVLTPYMDKTKPLYDQISTLEGSGQSPAAVYAQIDAIKNQYTGAALSHGGETYPTPDEFFFGGGTKNQQNYQTISMTVRPISYLSDAQRKLVGYPSFTGEDDMWKAISDLKASAASKMTAAGVNSGTIAADKVNQYVDNQSARIAASYGQEGLDAYKLETALPYVRLQSTGFASSDPIMQQAFATASYINAAITKAKLSPTNTTSPIAVELKTAFYDWMQTQMQDPTFAKNMQSLSAALPLPNGVPRSGALLWEDVFFGQSNQAYISSAFLNSFTGAS